MLYYIELLITYYLDLFNPTIYKKFLKDVFGLISILFVGSVYFYGN